MAVVCIEGEMSVYRAAELKPALLGPALDGGLLELDLSAVTEIDSAGLQLLLLARREVLARDGGLRVVAQSPSIAEMLALLRLNERLDACERTDTAEAD
jgi:anti-anti-sigma factor